MRYSLVWTISLLLAFSSSSHAQTHTRRMLILHSFETDFAPDSAVTRVLRNELRKQSLEPIDVVEISLQPTPSIEVFQEAPVVDYLRSTLARQRLDLVVTMSGQAALFAQKYRGLLFPTTPLIMGSVDPRWLRNRTLTVYDTAVTHGLEPGKIIEDILTLFPATTTVFVVIGASPLETFWRDEVDLAFQPFKDRLKFVYLNHLSFADMLQQSATLPAHSAIYYALLSVDAKGFFQTEERTLTELRAVANAPMFGLFTSQLGNGIIGGSLLSTENLGLHTAEVALRILRGESPRNINIPPEPQGQRIYDWRELQRWGISETRLPAGSLVRFRQPSLWDQYKFYVVGVTSLLVLQTALIAGLIVQRVRRRRVEGALRESEQRFRAMADTAPVMIWRSAVDRLCDFFNQPWLEFRGRTMEQEMGSGWTDGVHTADLERCLATYTEAFDERRPFRMEYRLRRADGEYRWVLDSGVPRFAPDGAFAGYIGSCLDITERQQAEAELRDSESALRKSSEQNLDLAGRLITAQEAERSRIGRDLHDDVCQRLAGLAIMLSGLKQRLKRSTPQPDVEEALATLQERTSTLATDVRNLSHELHPGVLEHAGLVPVLKALCDEFARLHKVDVTFSADEGKRSVDVNAALCIYRVTQEALANTAKHARASTVRVRLTRTAEAIELQVVDDGIGFESGRHSPSGLGLRSIDERVRFNKGSARVESHPGQGTSVLVRVPLSPATTGDPSAAPDGV